MLLFYWKKNKMKRFASFDRLIKCIFYLSISLTIITQYDLSVLGDTSMNASKEIPITEELRLNVPYEYKKAWLKAEKEIWEPWLSKQEGFISRQIFYNKEKGEALLLVNWENKKLWKNISSEEVNVIQNLFEKNVKKTLNISENPFQLIYEGELFNQK